jgi:Fe-S-cluster containining protein
MNPEKNSTRRTCNRCGECCRKGGPALHLEDRERVENGVIHSRWLYTLREGEPVRENVAGGMHYAVSDIIKVKGRDDTWTCIFFDDSASACTIYDQRPLECRVLKCWDTRRIRSMYEKNRLTRRDLLASVEGLWDLVEDHQRRCSIDRARELIATLGAGASPSAREELTAMIRYDEEIRKLVVEKGGMAPDMLDFVFGRPLAGIVETLGVRLRPGR